MSERAEIEVPQADLHAYVDGQLVPSRRRAVEAWLAGHPMIAATLDGWRAQNAAIRELFVETGDAAQLASDWRRIRALRARQERPRPRWIAPLAAAGLVALGVVGGAAFTLGRTGATTPAPTTAPATAVAPPGSIAAASRDAWLVYAGETTHPVEVGAKRAAHLTDWLSRRLDAPVYAPDLTPVGLRLLGGRLVPFGASPAALLLYEDEAGRRVGVLLARDPVDTGAGLRFDQGPGLATASWHAGGVGYALSGPYPRAHLAAIAAAFRGQPARGVTFP